MSPFEPDGVSDGEEVQEVSSSMLACSDEVDDELTLSQFLGRCSGAPFQDQGEPGRSDIGASMAFGPEAERP